MTETKKMDAEPEGGFFFFLSGKEEKERKEKDNMSTCTILVFLMTRHREIKKI